MGEVDRLPLLLSTVNVPSAVLCELRPNSAPAAVRHGANHPPAWVDIQYPRETVIAGLEKIHEPESATNLVAFQLEADILIIDEMAARAMADRHGLALTVSPGGKGLTRSGEEQELATIAVVLASAQRPVARHQGRKHWRDRRRS